MVDWIEGVTYPFKKIWNCIKWWWGLDWKWKLASLIFLTLGIFAIYCRITDFNLVLTGKRWLGISEHGNYKAKIDSTEDGLVKTIVQNKGNFQLSQSFIEAESRSMRRPSSGSDLSASDDSSNDSGSDSD